MNPMQELIDQAAVRVAPSSDGQEKRVLVRISNPKIDRLYHDIQDEFDRSPLPEHDAFRLNARIAKLLDAFFGRRR